MNGVQVSRNDGTLSYFKNFIPLKSNNESVNIAG